MHSGAGLRSYFVGQRRALMVKAFVNPSLTL